MTEWQKGFEPVIDKNSKILILGSFPSVKSRAQGFYYGNKQNRFWGMLSIATGKSVPEDILSRKNFLIENKIALWDVIKESKISGSSDTDITEQNSIPVDFDKVLCYANNLKLIICNGKKAYNIFKKFNTGCKLEAVCLPSTSPANPTFNVEVWVEQIKKFLF